MAKIVSLDPGKFKDKKLGENVITEDLKYLSSSLKTLAQALLQNTNLIFLVKAGLLGVNSLIAKILLQCGYNEARHLSMKNGQNILKLTSYEDIESFLQNYQQQIVDLLKTEHKEPVTQVLDYIRQNHAKNLTLKETAELFHFSTSHLSRLIKATTGLNFSEYLNQVRLQRAAELLKDPSLKISLIATQVGYRDPSYFNRLFKKHFGVTPKEYRNTINQ